jgi:hypothetical protein
LRAAAFASHALPGRLEPIPAIRRISSSCPIWYYQSKRPVKRFLPQASCVPALIFCKKFFFFIRFAQ